MGTATLRPSLEEEYDFSSLESKPSQVIALESLVASGVPCICVTGSKVDTSAKIAEVILREKRESFASRTVRS